MILNLQVGNPVIVELLLQWGVPVDSQDSYGRTPLAYALFFEHAQCAHHVLSRGASPDLPNFSGTKLRDYVPLYNEKIAGDGIL